MNKGVYFNGIDNYGEVDDNTILRISGSMSFCIRLKVVRPYNPWCWLINKDTWATANYMVILDTLNDINFGFGDGTKSYNVRTYVSLLNYDWLWVFCVYDYDAGYIYIYYNDVEMASDNVGSISQYQDDYPLFIGSAGTGRTNRNYCGYVSDVIIYSEALTLDKIKYIIKNNKPAEGKINAWFSFNQGMGTVFKDYVNGLRGKLYGTVYACEQNRGWYFDNGGIYYPSNITINYNYVSVVSVFRMRQLEMGGTPVSGRQVTVHPGGNKCMIWNDTQDQYIRFTNYDGTWKAIASDPIQPMNHYVAVGVMNDTDEHIYIAFNGKIISHNYRTDIGDAGTSTGKWVQNGSTQVNTYKLHGEMLASMIYNRPLTEDEIINISNIGGWLNPPQNGLIHYVRYDQLIEGNTPEDVINNVQGTNIGTPRPVVRKALR